MARENFDVKMGPEASLVVVFIALVLGIAACGGGIYAEIIYRKDIGTYDELNLGQQVDCVFQKQLAQVVALASAGCLLVGHLLVAVLGGCVCCCTLTYARGKAHNFSMLLFLINWLFFLVSMVCFLSGAYINEYHTSKTYFSYDFDLRRCFRVKSFVYIVAAGSALLSSIFSVLYYGQAQKSKYEAWVEQGAPTPRLYSTETKKSFVIAGPAKKGPLKGLGDEKKEPLLKPKRVKHRDSDH